MKLEVVEVPVFGEPPLVDPSAIKAPLFDSFNPSRGLSPSFGIHTVNRADGEHRLYVMKMEGEIAAVLYRPATTLCKKRLVKVGFSNDVKRRCNEPCLSGCYPHPLNVGCAHSPEYSPSKVGAAAPPAIPSSERTALKGWKRRLNRNVNSLR